MINRYLGNKSSIIDPIIKQIDSLCEEGDWICDIFSGTLAVSMALKRHGYSVIANDINKFSHSFGVSYLTNNTIPRIDLKKLKIDQKVWSKRVNDSLLGLKDIPGYTFLKDESNYTDYKQLAILLNYLNHITVKDVKSIYRNEYFFNSYTEKGTNSAFQSLRGTTGKRRFFTPENGKRIDVIINKILEWYKEGQLNDVVYCLLVSILSESIEKVSNTQGTFHDFPRDTYDSRALKALSLRLPSFDDVICSNKGHILGRERDSLEFIKEVRPHKLLYIDPPYNFRQYTSYYFMLNLICEYCEIGNLNEYFSKLQFVRGQNVEKDFKSTFCQSGRFVPSVTELIQNAKTKYVVMSYFDGRNHGSNSIREAEGNSVESIDNFFQSSLFIRGSYKKIPIRRLNYQSYIGHKANELNEFLFIAKKKITVHELVPENK